MDRLYYTPREAAQILAISDDAVLDLIRRGDIPALRVSARIIRIPIAGFDAWRAGAVPPRRRIRIAAAERREPLEIGEGESLPQTAQALRR